MQIVRPSPIDQFGGAWSIKCPLPRLSSVTIGSKSFHKRREHEERANANVIISVETGELPIGLIIALVGLVGLETVTLRYAVVLTKRQKKKINKKYQYYMNK